jgi:hypothetical protein
MAEKRDYHSEIHKSCERDGVLKRRQTIGIISGIVIAAISPYPSVYLEGKVNETPSHLKYLNLQSAAQTLRDERANLNKLTDNPYIPVDIKGKLKEVYPERYNKLQVLDESIAQLDSQIMAYEVSQEKRDLDKRRNALKCRAYCGLGVGAIPIVLSLAVGNLAIRKNKKRRGELITQMLRADETGR